MQQAGQGGEVRAALHSKGPSERPGKPACGVIAAATGKVMPSAQHEPVRGRMKMVNVKEEGLPS